MGCRNGDYHLQSGSPGVDYCDDSLDTRVAGDVDFNARGVDQIDSSDRYAPSPFDVGADEEIQLLPIPEPSVALALRRRVERETAPRLRSADRVGRVSPSPKHAVESETGASL